MLFSLHETKHHRQQTVAHQPGTEE
ncbi:hypothetical protein CEXT_278381, partial [Caerostris extrusa]